MDPVNNPANPNPDDNKDTSLLDGGEADPNAEGKGSVLDQAGAEAKAAQEAADKKVLETPDDQLDDAGKAKKAELVKAKADADKATADKAKADAVPEKYEFKMPEGITLNQVFADKVTPILKEAKLSQAAAQKLVDVYIEQQKADETAKAEAFEKFLDDSRKETIAALGATYKEELAYAAKVRDKFLSTETIELLKATGMDNNKHFLMDLIKIGKLFSEAKLIDGKTTPSNANRTLGEVLYNK